MGLKPAISPVYKNNLNYVRKRPKQTLTMADLEREKDLEEDEFKTTAKPSTSRSMTTRICNKNVVYQNDEDDSLDDEQSDTEYEESNGYSSPDIDYESLPYYD